MGDDQLIRETLKALLLPKRLFPILLVCIPLVIAQGSFSRTPRAVWLGMAMCLAFVTVGPVSWRLLFREDVGAKDFAIRLAIYVGVGAFVMTAFGVLLPNFLGLGVTFLTRSVSLAVSGALFLVGGWGLARDISLEANLVREKHRAAALAREAEQAQLLALRAHLDPHFLFNTLNAIAEWCREDGEVAEHAVLQLSSILRTVMQGVTVSAWTLAEEIALSRALLSMHQLRDPSRFSVDFQVPEAFSPVLVPPMILLPLVENAVKHGPAAGHRGAIQLTATSDGTQLQLVLSNPGANKGPRAGSAGLATVSRRLALAYAHQATIEIKGTNTSTRVDMTLPLRGPERGVMV